MAEEADPRAWVRAWHEEQLWLLAVASEYLHRPAATAFRPGYGLPREDGCRGTTRAGRPCCAPPSTIGPDGYCHLHRPARLAERVGDDDVR